MHSLLYIWVNKPREEERLDSELKCEKKCVKKTFVHNVLSYRISSQMKQVEKNIVMV